MGLTFKLSQEKLDVRNKSRANIFNWRGQFTPQFVDYLLDSFARPGDIVIEPFSGSGTVLLECSTKDLSCYGFEINPAAYAMSKFFSFANITNHNWINQTSSLQSTGKQKVEDMTVLLNHYKDYLEVELIARRGSPFIRRQKGQLKLDNTVLEEFLIYLVDPAILNGLPSFEIETGPQTAFMSLSFRPANIHHLDQQPDVVLKLKDQDFTIGKTLYYQFSADSNFEMSKTVQGSLFLAVLAAECKVNYDKTMFQECAGTASRLKQGCPISRYYALVEYLDMQPEDCRLTDIDNVFLLRHAKRLPFEKRNVYEEVKNQHENFPIDNEVVFRFVQEIQAFINAVWYDPDEALARGSFV